MSLRADSASGYRGAAVATLAAAVAGLTMLSGILRLRVFDLHSTPLIAVQPLPPPSWPHQWLASLRTAQALQGAAVAEWLNVVLALLLALLMFAGISAVIALFAHATARRYEVALAAVVGASRAQLTALHLRNAGINILLALLVGLPSGLLAGFIANHTWPHVAANMNAGAWTVASIVFAGALAMLVARAAAARMASAGWLGDVLAPEARTNPGLGAEDLRGALLHLQFAFTFALVAAAMLVWQQSRTGLVAEGNPAAESYVARVTLDERASVQQRRILLERLERAGAHVASPGVLLGVGPTDHVLSNCGPCSFGMMHLPFFALRTQQQVVGTGFFAAAGFALAAGREFESRDLRARHIVVNDTFARLAFQGQHAIGKTIQVGGLRGDWYTVVGVVRDIPMRGLTSFAPDPRNLVRSNIPGHEPAVYFYAAERPPVIFDTISSAPLRPRLAGISVLGVQPLRELFASARAPERWFGGLLGALALTAAAVALLSLAAMTLLNVRQREMEIAARRSVGARRRDIVRMIMRATLLTCVRGTLVGIVLSVALARAIQMVLPAMRILDIEVLAFGVLLLAAASLVAAIVPARAATRVQPAQIHS